MTATTRRVKARPRARRIERRRLRRLVPALTAAVLAVAYVLISPPSLDLAAHLFRARLFSQEGFALWDNLWYSGHYTLGYSVLFPAMSAALTPQVAAAAAAVGTAAVFESVAHRHCGEEAWLGAVLFGAATAIDLFTGRLALAFGALPALAALAALDRGRTIPACACALLAALCSPVAALFCGLAAAAVGSGGWVRHRRVAAAGPAGAVAASALVPTVALAVVFPQSGSEPFALLTFLPLVVISIGVWWAAGPDRSTLRAGALLYLAAAAVLYVVPTPIGSNIARLGTLLAAPVAALLLWPRRRRLFAILIVPLLYVGVQAPVSDLWATAGNPATTAAYYRPLLRFLDIQRARGGPFRVEIPFTRLHWEALYVAQRVPLARGWERQLDIGDNHLFYDGRLTSGAYVAWLHRSAVRFVAVAAGRPDPSARGEIALIEHGVAALREVRRTGAWTIYAVRDATPLAQGAAVATAIGPDSVSLSSRRAGTTLVHVRFTPFWAIAAGHGCVEPDGPLTRVTLSTPGAVRLVIRFSLRRIGATSPRCD